MTKIENKEHNDGRKKSTLWNYLFLNVGIITLIINGILIVPFYLHYIKSTVYGAWLATGNILNWITIVVDPGVSMVILQRVSHARGRKDKKEVGLAIASGILISVILFAFALGVGYIISFFISDVAKIDEDYRQQIIGAFRIAIIGTACSLLSFTFNNIILAYQKTKIHGFFTNGINISGIFLTIILLTNNFGVNAIAYTILYRGVVSLIYAISFSQYLIKKDSILLNFQFKYFKSFSKIFTYTFVSRLFDTFASNIDLIVVSRYIGSHYVTVLDTCRRPIKIVSGISNNTTISMVPALSHLFGEGNVEKIRTVTLRIWRIILWLSGFIIGGFILFNKGLIRIWVGEEFWIGNVNNIILCLSFLLLSIAYNLSNITYSMGDLKNNSLINIVRNSTYLILLYFLSKKMGLTGVVLAFVFPLAVVLVYYPRKVCQISFFTKTNIRSILKEIFLIVLIIGICVMIALSINFSVSFFWLTVLMFVYACCFGSTLILFSKSFKLEILQLKNTIFQKLKLGSQMHNRNR